MDVKKIDSNPSRPKKVVSLALFLLGLLLLGLVFYLFTRSDSWELPQMTDVGKKIEERKEAAAPTGEIYLTLSPFDYIDPIINVYSLNLSTSELNPVFDNKENDNFMAEISKDAKLMVFVRRYSDFLSQILTLNLETHETKEITNRSFFFERNPVFSPNTDLIAFWIYESEENPYGFGLMPEDHSIYLASGDTLIKIGQGVFPKFSSDGQSIFFLKNDGLYLFNISTQEEHFLMQLTFDLGVDGYGDEEILNYPKWLSFRFNVSNELLMLTDSSVSLASLYSISSWTPFLFEEIFIKEPVFGAIWPTFSPCGKYFAVQGSSIMIYDIKRMEPVFEFSLDDYSAEYIWMTDWVSK